MRPNDYSSAKRYSGFKSKLPKIVPQTTWYSGSAFDLLLETINNIPVLPALPITNNIPITQPMQTIIDVDGEEVHIGDEITILRCKTESPNRRDTDYSKYKVIFYGFDSHLSRVAILFVGSRDGHSLDGRLPPHSRDTGWFINPDELSVKKVSSTKTKKEIKLDLKHLEKLIIADKSKEEIVAVLKQHEKSEKLFKEWGLGDTIEYGRGMTFLFYGKPGTGKTWGANMIAKSVGRELLVIGAAEIQTQEPGGANRNIQNAFKSAKSNNKVLLLDECDSLITSRNSVGMIIGSEINTLLTEIEKFDGICILATNRIETLDEALERRIALIVEFPEPNHAQRAEIWKTLLPKKMPVAKDVTPETLADFALTGGQIKNVLLQSARLAIAEEKDEVSLAHFEQAIGRVNSSKNLMGKQDRWIQVGVSDKSRTAS